MPLEGHSSDCDCGCCDTEDESETQVNRACVCPSCGKQSIATGNIRCDQMKCSACNVTLKPAT